MPPTRLLRFLLRRWHRCSMALVEDAALRCKVRLLVQLLVHHDLRGKTRRDRIRGQGCETAENPVLFWVMVAGNLFYVIAVLWFSYLAVLGRMHGR